MMMLLLSAALLFPSASVPRVGFYVGNGTSSLDAFYSTLHVAAAHAFGGTGSYAMSNLTEVDVQGLKPSAFDVVVFPGGSGNGQSEAIGPVGISALQAFVKAGRGYIGTCGGAFLALQHVKFYGDPAPPTQEPWNRGHGDVKVEFTAQGLTQLDLPKGSYGGNLTIMYWQGPIVKTSDFTKYAPAVKPLAYFRTEIHSGQPNKTTGEMVNTPAVTSLDGYGGGTGRVVLNSPHPELTPNVPAIYAGELVWVTHRER